MTSGIPQGSVLGPILFTIYINDLPDTLINTTKLFADDTKIYSVIKNDADIKSLQNDLDKLATWSKKWQLTFNKNKCKHIHLGQNEDSSAIYYMDGEIITKTSQEKDLGVIVDNKLKFQDHINTQVKKANKILGIIKRSFSYLDKEMLLILYKSLVRPHLEYASTVWTTTNKKERINIENVQRRATKILPTTKLLSYPERLKFLGLPSLQYRRSRSDMVETYKIINNIDKIECRNLFPLNNSQTRGHSQKIYKKHCRTNIRKFHFSQRVVDTWNNLPEEIVNASSVNSFKNRINIHWKNIPFKFTPYYEGPEAGCAKKLETDHRGSSLHKISTPR